MALEVARPGAPVRRRQVRGVGAQPDRRRAVPGGQLLRGALLGTRRARAVSHHQRAVQRGPAAQLARRHPAQPARHRPGHRHLRGRADGQQGPEPARPRRHHAGQHGQGARRPPRGPARGQPRRVGARRSPRSTRPSSCPRSSPAWPSRTSRCRRSTVPPAASTKPTACCATAPRAALRCRPAASSRCASPAASSTWRSTSATTRCASGATRSSWRRRPNMTEVALEPAREAGQPVQGDGPLRAGARAPGSALRAERGDVQPRHRPAHSHAADPARHRGRSAAGRDPPPAHHRPRADGAACAPTRCEVFQVEALQRVAVLAEFRDTDTAEHPVRVGELAADLAAELGETHEFVERLGAGGAPARHRQGRRPRLDPAQARAAHRRRVRAHARRTPTFGARDPRAAARRRWCSWPPRWRSPTTSAGTAPATRRPRGRAHPAQRPHRGRRRRVRRARSAQRVYKHAWASIDAVNYVVAGRGTQFEPQRRATRSSR